MVVEDWPVWLLAIGVAALFIGYSGGRAAR